MFLGVNLTIILNSKAIGGVCLEVEWKKEVYHSGMIKILPH